MHLPAVRNSVYNGRVFMSIRFVDSSIFKLRHFLFNLNLKMQLFCKFARLALATTLIFSEVITVKGSRNFKGYKVIRTEARTQEQLSFLEKLYENGELDFWTSPSIERGTEIMVHPDKLADLKRILNSKQISFKIVINDLEMLIVEQEEQNRNATVQQLRASKNKNKNSEMTWKVYQPLDVILKWLNGLSQKYPQLVTLQTIGKSWEGRALKLVKISNTFPNETSNRNKSAIWIDALFHAREWVTAATATYIIDQLVKHTSKYSDILDRVDFYILPIANPDGYSYSWTTDRMWRKTRSNHRSLRRCRGVDPNRNFSLKFGGPGTSSNKCSPIYRGPQAFSEPETKAVRDYIMKSGVKFEAYLTIHSFSQLWMYPWGYTNALPTDWKDLDTLAKKSVDAIKATYGTQFSYGSSTNVLYEAAGGSDDWAKGEAKIKYSYTLELRDTGVFGFLLPPSQILPTAEETWNGIQVVARHISSR